MLTHHLLRVILMPDPVVPVVPAAADAPAAVVNPADAAAIASAAEGQAPVVPPVVPDTYDLKLPQGATVDPSLVERTAAIARTLGLTNEKGQQLLDGTLTELATATAKASESAVEAYKAKLAEDNANGGAEWTRRDTAWRAQMLADPMVAGDDAKLAVLKTQGQAVIARFGGEDVTNFLEATGLGSHPAVVRLLGKIGAAMGESSFVSGSREIGKTSTREERMYGPDGRGPAVKAG